MVAEKDENYYSPRLRDPELWNESHPEHRNSDYVFIRVDKPLLRSHNFIKVISASSEQLKRLKVHLYRGKSRYKTQRRGLNWSKDEAIPAHPDKLLESLYQSPQKVNQACKFNGQKGSKLYHNCPTEPSVSGAPYIARSQGKPYVVGMNTFGVNANFSTSEAAGGSSMLKASEFCKDYEKGNSQAPPHV